MPEKRWRIGASTTTKNARMGRSARTRRLCCSIASAQPARRREKAGKLQPPAIQSWVSQSKTGTDSSYERGQVGEHVTRSRPPALFEGMAILQVVDGPSGKVVPPQKFTRTFALLPRRTRWILRDSGRPAVPCIISNIFGRHMRWRSK
jgi:hypothetical protein